MRIGSIVLATDQGLGYLAKDFYDAGLITEVFIWPHSSRVNHHDWYPNASSSIEEMLTKIDTLILFEEAFDWKVIPRARELGIKTVLMPMYECTRSPLPYIPDLILTPSDLDQKYFPNGTRINVPVPEYIEWKLREKAKVFVHNAGNGGLGGRNGTKELLEAMKFVKSPIKLIVRSQSLNLKSDDPRVTVEHANLPRKHLYSVGDVFIFPEKFNGLSLPIQEAFASGMLIMCGDRFPMNTWLPKGPLIPIEKYQKERIATEFDSAVIRPEDIAKSIDIWYNRDITGYSLMGKNFKKENSWKILKERYETLLSA
jgi:hypothetical protein